MDLYILRHGQAVNIGESEVHNDSTRFLTEKGKHRTEQICKMLANFGCKPDIILSSPLVRAVETAEIAAEELAPGTPISKVNYLKPSSRLENALSRLAEIQVSSVLLVGHIPSLAKLAAQLCNAGPGFNLHLRKSGVCWISFPKNIDKGKGSLEFLISPGFLKAVQ